MFRKFWFVFTFFSDPHLSPAQVVEFWPLVEGESVDLNLLKSSIRVEHLGLYMNTGLGDEGVGLEYRDN
jgi:hypothetical protein